MSGVPPPVYHSFPAPQQIVLDAATQSATVICNTSTKVILIDKYKAWYLSIYLSYFSIMQFIKVTLSETGNPNT